MFAHFGGDFFTRASLAELFSARDHFFHDCCCGAIQRFSQQKLIRNWCCRARSILIVTGHPPFIHPWFTCRKEDSKGGSGILEVLHMSWFAGNAKHLALGLLVLQNTSLVLLMRYSLTMEGTRYVKSTAVAMMEVRRVFHRKVLLLASVVHFPSAKTPTIRAFSDLGSLLNLYFQPAKNFNLL